MPASVAHIARDPLDPAFDDAAFARAVRRKHSGLKRALLDQSLVSGVGNIYADEALWRARLHFARPTETLTPARGGARARRRARRSWPRRSTQGGTSFDALYVNVNGRVRLLRPVARGLRPAGQPCPRCGTPIRRDAFMNRSSYTCPHLPAPARAAAAGDSGSVLMAVSAGGLATYGLRHDTVAADRRPASVRTHSDPHPAHANRGSRSSTVPGTTDQAQTPWHGCTASGRRASPCAPVSGHPGGRAAWPSPVRARRQAWRLTRSRPRCDP